MLYNLDLHKAAVVELDKALAADATLVQAYKYLALSHRALGDTDAEASALAQYRKMNPFDKEEK
jgi:predicted Zn-dependent protease